MTAGRMSETRTSIIGAFLVALGPISMALYTPAMPELVHAFHTNESMIKLTLSLYFGGFACAQLVSGTLSDAFGRRAGDDRLHAHLPDRQSCCRLSRPPSRC